jgi:hypothetical protein
MEYVSALYGHLVYFTANWYILWLLHVVTWYTFPVLVCCIEKSLATLVCTRWYGGCSTTADLMN